MESRDYNKLVTITKKKQTLRYREQTSGYRWEEGNEQGRMAGCSSGPGTTLGLRMCGRELGSRTYREETHPVKSMIICPVLI